MFAAKTKFRMKAVAFNKDLPWIIGSLKHDFKDSELEVLKVEDNVLTVLIVDLNKTKRCVIEEQFKEYFEIL